VSNLWDPRLWLPHLKEKPNKTISSDEDCTRFFFFVGLDAFYPRGSRRTTDGTRCHDTDQNLTEENWGKFFGKFVRRRKKEAADAKTEVDEGNNDAAVAAAAAVARKY